MMTHLTIRTGTYFGECLGICRDVLTITAERMEYVASSDLTGELPPEIVDGRDTGADEWNRIVSLVDLAAFRALPDRIGDPDAADQGGEFVEISADDDTRRVDFDFDASVPTIDDLLGLLRGLRREFAARNR